MKKKRSIIQKLFIKEEKNICDLTIETISESHIFLRNSFGDEPSIVSLRDIMRFAKYFEFFKDYYHKKAIFFHHSIDDETEKINKIKNII